MYFLHFYLFIIFYFKYIHVPTINQVFSFILWLDHHSVSFLLLAPIMGLSWSFGSRQLKTTPSILGFFFFNYYFCGFFLHTSWFLFSFTTPTSAVVSWVFHSLILFLRVRSNHWSHIGSGSRFLCVVPPSLPGHPSQLHSRGRQSSGNIPVMLYRFYPAPVQGWTRSVFLFISLSTKFLANVFTQPITKY